MKLHTSIGPNPRTVNVFLLEKGIDIPRVEVDLFGAENRRPPFTARNPGGQLPVLELDDGRFIAETVAICEYLEEKHPTPPLIGQTAEERAEARMWQRRVELQITEHLYNAFRFAEGVEIFRPRMRVLPEAAEGLKAIVRDKLTWMDGLLEGRSYVAGDRLTLADLILYVALDFGRGYGQPFDQALFRLSAWFERVGARPSLRATAG